MADKRKTKRIVIDLTPTPAEIWAQEQRTRAARMAMFDRMLKDALDG
jgi:hypothetical protein